MRMNEMNEMDEMDEMDGINWVWRSGSHALTKTAINHD